MSLTIRPALDADYDAIYRIWLEGVSNSFRTEQYDPAEIQRLFRQNFDSRNGVFNFWVAESAGVVAGWQSLIPFSCNPFRRNEYAESSTYITKAFRQMNVGKLLHAHALREAERSGLKCVVCFIAKNNAGAGRLTEEFGYFVVGEIRTPGEDIPKLFLVRPVSN